MGESMSAPEAAGKSISEQRRMVADIPEGDLRLFIGKNADYYIPMFEKIQKYKRNKRKGKETPRHEQLSNNGGAFFAAMLIGFPGYLIYRKMYLYALITILAGFAAYGVCDLIGDTRLAGKLIPLMNTGFAFFLSNTLYYGYVKKEIAKIHRDYADEAQRNEILVKRGGVNSIGMLLYSLVVVFSVAFLIASLFRG